MTTEKESDTLSDSLAGTGTLRIARIHKCDSFYTPLEERFERISRLGKRALGVRAAGVTLIAHEKLWFKSIVGWAVSEQPLKDSFQQPMLDSGQPLIVPDTHKDSRYAKLPLVTADPKFRFYAGYPIRHADGAIIGTFCAFDVEPRKVDVGLAETLSDLGQMAERELLTTDLWNAQSQLISKLDTARRQALLDPLTRVWNRRGSMELLELVLDESKSSGERFAVCLADIDHFKDINDQYGHDTGDQALIKIAAGITASIRPDDVVSRYGGDEFLVILRDVAPDICRLVAERICDKIRKTRVRSGDGSLAVTVSLGIAIIGSGETMTATQIVERADKALYHTKHQGRDGSSLWPDDIS